MLSRASPRACRYGPLQGGAKPRPRGRATPGAGVRAGSPGVGRARAPEKSEQRTAALPVFTTGTRYRASAREALLTGRNGRRRRAALCSSWAAARESVQKDQGCGVLAIDQAVCVCVFARARAFPLCADICQEGREQGRTEHDRFTLTATFTSAGVLHDPPAVPALQAPPATERAVPSRHALTNERFWSLSLSSDGRPLYEPVSTPRAVIQSLDVAPYLPRARHAPRAREVSQSLVSSIQRANSRPDSAAAGFHIRQPSVCCLYLRLLLSDCLCRSTRYRHFCADAVFALDLATQRFVSTLKRKWPRPETLTFSRYLVP